MICFKYNSVINRKSSSNIFDKPALNRLTQMNETFCYNDS